MHCNFNSFLAGRGREHSGSSIIMVHSTSTAHHVSSALLPSPAHSLAFLPFAMLSRVRRIHSARITSDAFAATKVSLNAIQASTDAVPHLKSVVSAVIVLLEMSEKIRSNKKGCEHIAERSAQLVQDIWRQTKDFNVELPAEVERSVAEIETLFNEIEKFFNGLEKESRWERFARQDDNKSQVQEYGRLLGEAMLHFSINLELSIHRLHLESAAADQKRHAAMLASNRKRHAAMLAADRKRHAAVLAVSRTSESERLQLLTQIRGDVHMGKYVLASFFF
ncbi:hypothetical protein B0H19DRAFT_193404 [Mycena capillaripes]|nr:hypothetical protein B0H19DRAFT_193404 [Mycena capillaripes]